MNRTLVSLYTCMHATVVASGETPSLSHEIPSEGEYNKLALRSSSKSTKWQAGMTKLQVEYGCVPCFKVTQLLGFHDCRQDQTFIQTAVSCHEVKRTEHTHACVLSFSFQLLRYMASRHNINE